MGSNNSKNAFSDYEDERENECYNECGFYIPSNKKCHIYKLVDDNVEIKNCQVDTIELPLETDSVVRSVLHKFIERSSFGKKKYGTDLDRDDLSLLDSEHSPQNQQNLNDTFSQFPNDPFLQFNFKI